MSTIVKFGGVEIPAVSVLDVTPELIADRDRTVGGKMRQDYVTTKRVWKIQTLFLTPDEEAAIMNYLASINYGSFDLWIDEFGPETNTVKVYVTPDNIKRTPFGRDGDWYTAGKQLSFTVEEQ